MNTKKVYSIFSKPVDFQQLKKSIYELKLELNIAEFPQEKFIELLMKLNLNPYSQNIKILQEALELCYYNSTFTYNLSLVYKKLASKNNCTCEKIKSCLRGITKNVNRNSNVETLSNLFFICSDDKYISTKHLINGLLFILKSQSMDYVS